MISWILFFLWVKGLWKIKGSVISFILLASTQGYKYVFFLLAHRFPCSRGSARNRQRKVVSAHVYSLVVLSNALKPQLQIHNEAPKTFHGLPNASHVLVLSIDSTLTQVHHIFLIHSIPCSPLSPCSGPNCWKSLQFHPSNSNLFSPFSLFPWLLLHTSSVLSTFPHSFLPNVRTILAPLLQLTWYYITRPLSHPFIIYLIKPSTTTHYP